MKSPMVPKRNEQKNENAKRILTQAGYSTKIGAYAKGGAVHEDEAEDKALIKKMVKKKDLKEKKAEGGFVHGGMPKKRLDKISRQTAKGDANTTQPFPPGKEKFAAGGKVKGKGGKTQVNVIVGHGQPQSGQPAPMPVPAAGPAMPPPRPPMMPPQGGPPPGAMPPPGAGMPPAGMPMRAKGGKVTGKVPKMEFGAGGGKGRLEKKELYGKPAKN